MKSCGCFGKAGLLFEGLAIVFCCLDIFPARFINAAQVEMWKCVGFITRRIQRAFEPANAAVSIAFGQKIASDVIVRVSQSFIDANCFQTFFYGLVIAVLKAINPTEKGMRFGSWKGFYRAFIELDRLLEILGELCLISLLKKHFSLIFEIGRAH